MKVVRDFWRFVWVTGSAAVVGVPSVSRNRQQTKKPLDKLTGTPEPQLEDTM